MGLTFPFAPHWTLPHPYYPKSFAFSCLNCSCKHTHTHALVTAPQFPNNKVQVTATLSP